MKTHTLSLLELRFYSLLKNRITFWGSHSFWLPCSFPQICNISVEITTRLRSLIYIYRACGNDAVGPVTEGHVMRAVEKRQRKKERLTPQNIPTQSWASTPCLGNFELLLNCSLHMWLRIQYGSVAGTDRMASGTYIYRPVLYAAMLIHHVDETHIVHT